MGTRVFIPFGEFLPDRKLFGNEGLLQAFGVTPAGPNYLSTPPIERLITNFGSHYYGLHIHQTFESGLRKSYAYAGDETRLWEIDYEAATPTLTNKSGTSAPYSFLSSPPLDAELWMFTSFGENIVATNFNDPVQFLATTATANFADMITSTFKPQGRFAFAVRQNLFLAYCFLPSTFDDIASGTHPQLVVWSQNDNIQVFGSEAVDTSHIGAGYQQFVGGDLGPITATHGAGDFGLIFLAGGIVRIDGPPYEFRVIVRGDTTLYPYSVFQLGDDVYYWGAGGPSVLRNGEGPSRRLGIGKIQRSLLDNTTGFGDDFARRASLGAREVSGGADPANQLARWAYRPMDTANLTNDTGGAKAYLMIDYAITEERFTVSKCPTIETPTTIIEQEVELQFQRQEPAKEAAIWGPFGSLFGIAFAGPSLGTFSQTLARFNLDHDEGQVPGIQLRTAFGRLSDTRGSRIVAVRPVWSNTEGQAANIEGATSIQVHTKNKPWEDETDSSIHTVFNEDGWIGTDSTVVGSYHSVTLKFAATNSAINEIHEIEGLEIEFVEGAEYGS